MKKLVRILAMVVLFSGFEDIQGAVKEREKVFKVAGSVVLGSLAAGLTSLATSNQGNKRSTLYSLLAAGFIGGAAWFAIPKIRKARQSLNERIRELEQEWGELQRENKLFFKDFNFSWFENPKSFKNFQKLIAGQAKEEMKTWWYSIVHPLNSFKYKHEIDPSLYSQIAKDYIRHAEELKPELEEILKKAEELEKIINSESNKINERLKVLLKNVEFDVTSITPDKKSLDNEIQGLEVHVFNLETHNKRLVDVMAQLLRALEYARNNTRYSGEIDKENWRTKFTQDVPLIEKSEVVEV